MRRSGEIRQAHVLRLGPVGSPPRWAELEVQIQAGDGLTREAIELMGKITETVERWQEEQDQ